MRVVSRRSRAFTLVEMLIAMFVTSLISIVLWSLFGSGSRAAVYGTWYSARTAELRTGLRMIREDLAKATYTSVITPTNVTVQDADNTHFIGYHGGATPLPGSVTLLEFHICRPDRTAMPPPDSKPPADILVRLTANGSNLHYSKSAVSGTVQPEDTIDKDLIRDVDNVDIALKAQVTGDSTGTLTVKIHCKYPTEPAKGCEETTTAKLNLQYKTI